jgi:CRP-like cAMP-binding protein
MHRRDASARAGTVAAVPRQLEEISRAETVGMLQRVPLFSGLTKRQIVAVAKVVDHLSVGPGAVLVKELDYGTRLIIIRQGTAEVRRQGVAAPDGATGIAHSRRLGTVGPGDFVGELSLIDGKRTSASVVAETQLDALVIYRTRFNKLVGAMPELYPRLLLGMATRIRDRDLHDDVIG